MNTPGAKVLVTGGAGFIGSELVRQLCAAGAEVTVVDNLCSGRKENIEEVLGTQCRFIEDDIRNRERMRVLLDGVERVYHLACLGVRHSIHSPLENHEVNATATLELLIDARSAGVERFVHVSSSEVYGTACSVPMTEDHPTRPMTVYGASKLAGECYARAMHRTHDFPTVVVRPFNSYGPRSHHEGDSGEVIPRFLIRCLLERPMVIFGDGEQTRDFTYVEDTARGILKAGWVDDAIGDTLNLGCGSEISINDLATRVAAVTHWPDAKVVLDDPRPGDVLRLYSDSSHAGRVLDWQISVGLEEGLARVKEWLLSRDEDLDELLAQEIVRNWEVGG